MKECLIEFSLACSRRTALVALALLCFAGLAANALATGSPAQYLKQPDSWFASDEARRIAANLLSHQSDLGGWPKNTDTTAAAFTGDRKELKPTFDNGATTDELRFLARLFNATRGERYRKSFELGYDYILKAQYPTGGWPQFYPSSTQYHRHITFNDSAMVRLMEFLRESYSSERYAFLDEARKQAAREAFSNGVQCILKCQIRVNGQLTAWCAQHDEKDYSPRPGRSYELVSLSGAESVGIVRLLMSLENPSPDVVRAVDAAAAWFESAKLKGIRVVAQPDAQAPKGKNRVVVNDPAAPPLWARFYEIGTNRPMFVDRDGVPKYSLAEIGYERRNGYAWYGDWAQALLATEYPAWKKRTSKRPAPRQVSGIYPHLAMFNNESECGTGAVVPWAGRLWVVTYGPHLPFGSSDKLYEITPGLEQIIRPESVGGTHANRMIHRESRQLIIGPYLIDDQSAVRVIPPRQMPGRLTGNARHLTDPANKIYYATMEEGLYEVDVHTLDVINRIKDGNAAPPGQANEAHPATLSSKLPGYHGKGFYAGQGRVVYANNGEQGSRALVDPTIPSGALAEWRGEGDWQLVRRNQFTEVTGPGGLHGNPRPDTDPIWSIGWDARSLILMVLDSGEWHAYRLPKGSHCYDGAHGWNTEWPRIRDIGPEGKPDLLMTMHGTFWRFPATFSRANSAGLAPRSTYLKVVGDFCRWGDDVVLGCDDTAKSEFLNKTRLKGNLAAPGQSQSNLRFLKPEQLDQLGPALGRGAVWLDDPVKADVPSDPFLFAGYKHRSLHLAHDGAEAVTFTLEVDARGNGTWTRLRAIEVPARGYAWVEFKPKEAGAWVRLRADHDCARATAFFQYRNADPRPASAAAMFDGLARPGDRALSGGLLYARGANLRTLRFAAQRAGARVSSPAAAPTEIPGAKNGALPADVPAAGEDTRAPGTWATPQDLGCYDLDASLQLRRVDDPQGEQWMEQHVAIPRDVLTVDTASVLVVDDQGRRWRLPKGDPAFDRPGALGAERIDREVVTERDLLNCHGTFYELPAVNAGGFAKVRPIATHNRRITDYASYRGLLVMSGIADDAPAGNRRIIRSDDGKCALWVGAVDDLWQLGKPRGQGGPWSESAVRAGVPSDPYLMTGYDRKELRLSHTAAVPVRFHIEVDFAGTGQWAAYREFTVPAGKPLKHRFPDNFSAYWVRLVCDRDATATASFEYR